MTSWKKIAIPVAALSLVALVAWPVYAHCGRCVGSAKEMIRAMDDGKVTLASAINAAEAHAKGKALGAHAQLDEGKLGFEVYVLANDKIMDVTVDYMGKAVKMDESKMLPAHDHPHDGKQPMPKTP